MDAGVKVYPGGRLVIHALPLKSLIVAAYDVGYWQLSGGEDWMGKDVYDVEAKPSPQSGTYSLRHTFDTTMPQLAKFASDYVLHKPVIDQTAREGSFDYRDADAKVEQDNSDFEGSFKVFIGDIGLKLTSSKGPVDTLVIQHAEKPSAN